jgi:Flp pilus assembly protein TadD
VCYAQRRFQRAVDSFSEAIRISPKDSRPYSQRAYAYAALEKVDKARSDFDKALELDPKEITALVGRADVSRFEKRWDDALKDFNAALEINPGEFRALLGRASTFYVSGQYDKATADYAEVVKRFPEEPQPANDLAWMLATVPKDEVRDGKRAVELAEQACKITQYKNGAFLDTLAASYAESGDFEKALHWQEEAAKNSAEESEEVQKQIAGRVELYRQKKPFRETPLQ